MRRRAALLALAAALSSSACRHVVRVESEPAGAVVLEEGEVLGRTPLEIVETTGPADWRTLEVQHGDAAQRIALERGAWAPEPILAGAAVGAGAFVGGLGLMAGGAVLYSMALVSGIERGPGPEPFALLGGAVVMLTGGTVLASLGPYAPLVAAAQFGRRSPDVVVVDLREGEVTTSPSSLAERLVGRTPRALQEVAP